MTIPDAETLVKHEYGTQQHPMTSEVLGYGNITPTMVYELSKGRGFTNEPIFGVAIVEYDIKTQNTERRTDLSDCLNSVNKATAYIKDLREEYNEDQNL